MKQNIGLNEVELNSVYLYILIMFQANYFSGYEFQFLRVRVVAVSHACGDDDDLACEGNLLLIGQSAILWDFT